MSWRAFLRKGEQGLHPHHRYQLGVIFGFVLGIIGFFPFYLFIAMTERDMTVFQWYYIVPWLILYLRYVLRLRSSIRSSERINPMKRPIAHWVILGVGLVILHTRPIDYETIYGLDIAFSLFTILLADSYWDFKKIVLFQ